LPWLVAGFVVFVAGLALLTRRRGPASVDDPRSTLRALGFAGVYVATLACFARPLQPALLGTEHSPWLLALGDVTCVTLALLVWVMALSERRSWHEYGFRGAPSGRMLMAFAFGVLVAAFYSLRHHVAVAAGLTEVTPDRVVFAFMLALAGTAFPEEVLFRGYLQGSLDSRNRWLRVGLPALAFTGARALRHLPGTDLSIDRWLLYVLGVAFPLGVAWGVMRDLARGSLWPSLASNFLLEFGRALAGVSPVPGSAANS
jgi:membrane protease YdiL (CAAX protease family)